jgi:uncharacterized membrane protein
MADGVDIAIDGVEGVLLALVTASVASLASSSAATGAAVLVGVAAETLIITNLKDPIPYFQTSGEWGGIRDKFEKLHGDIGRKATDVSTYWHGNAATSFLNLVNNRLQPALDAEQKMSQAMRDALLSMGVALVSAIIAVISATVAAALACLAALATVVGAELQWAIVAAWVTFVVALIGALVTFFLGFFSTTNTIKDGFSTLKTQLGSQGDKITGAPLKVIPAGKDPGDGVSQSELNQSTNPQDWV